MWIRRTVRLCVVALFAIEISIIAMATAASATPITPGEDPEDEQVPITYFEDDVEAPRWLVVLEHTLDEAYGDIRPYDEYQDYDDEGPAYEADEPRPSREYRAYELFDATGKADKRKSKKAKVKLRRARPRHATLHLTHRAATRWLKEAGLRWTSSGGCTNRSVRHCTSLDSVRTGTVERMVRLKKRSGCPVTVTGGTETGHAHGRFSHGNGYKLDIGHNKCIDRYIKKNTKPAGVRSDGARLYRSPSGTVFADEGDHWDILFK